MLSLKTDLGHILAPWPFVLFGFIALVGGAVAWSVLGFARGVMVAFDAATLAFIFSCIPLFSHDPPQMREAAPRNDANRGFLLILAAAVTGVILVCVGKELSQKGRPHLFDLALVIATLCFCWLFSTLVYALHYAHLFYTTGPKGQDSGGLLFPETEEPDYWDFVYFSSCLGMTFQTSDVNITSRSIRRTSMFQSLGAFVFNIGVIAFSINILGGS